MSDSRVIRIGDIAPALPALHYDLKSRRIVNDADARSFRISHVTLDPGGRSDPHVHAGVEQLYLVLKGAMGVQIEGQEFRLKPGEAALVQPGEKHRNFNVDPGETEYLVITGTAATN